MSRDVEVNALEGQLKKVKLWVKIFGFIAVCSAVFSIFLALVEIPEMMREAESTKEHADLSILKVDNAVNLVKSEIDIRKKDLDSYSMAKTDEMFGEIFKKKEKLLIQLTKDAREVNFGTWKPIDLYVGKVPFKGDKKEIAYKIPNKFPETPKQILVYVHARTGLIKGNSQYYGFSFSVDQDNKSRAEFRLGIKVYPRNGFGYTSENVWLPYPENRLIYAKRISEATPVSETEVDLRSEIRVIGYR